MLSICGRITVSSEVQEQQSVSQSANVTSGHIRSQLPGRWRLPASQVAANASWLAADGAGQAARGAAVPLLTVRVRGGYAAAGLLLQKELDYLDGAISNPKRPFVAIVGGSKVCLM